MKDVPEYRVGDILRYNIQPYRTYVILKIKDDIIWFKGVNGGLTACQSSYHVSHFYKKLTPLELAML